MNGATWRRCRAGLAAAALVIGSRAILRADEPSVGAVAETEEAASGYWLGVACEPVGETIRAQLAIPKDQGLVVQQVMPDSPAAKAGLSRHDILLQVGERPLASTADLQAAVAAGKDNELSLELLRSGKPLLVAVKPAARPKSLPGEATAQLPGGPDQKALEEWLKQFGVEPGHAGRMQIARPGAAVLMGPGGHTGSRVELPENVSIDIHREGKKPAQITVQRGDQKWEVTEKQLDKLPDDVRRSVEMILGGGPMRIDLHSLPLMSNPISGAPGTALSGAQVSPDLGNVVSALQRQVESQQRAVDDLSREMKEMHRTMRDFQKQIARPAPPAPK